MDDMFVREWDDLLPHIQDDLENGEFTMKSKNFQAAKEQSAALLAWAQQSEQAAAAIAVECNIQREQDARRQCACCKESYAINTYRTRRLLLTYCTVACAVRAGMAEQEAEQQLEEIIYHDAF